MKNENQKSNSKPREERTGRKEGVVNKSNIAGT